MIKIIRKIIYIALCVFVAALIIDNYDYIVTEFESLSTKFINQNNEKDSIIDSKGELVSKETVKDLEKSSITGDELEFDPLFYPYYGLLSSLEKLIYKQFYANIVELEKNIVPRASLPIEDTTRVIESLYNDHPELYWLDTFFYYKYTDDNEVVEIILEYNETIDNFEDTKKVFDEQTEKIVSAAKNYETDYAKEKFVHNVLIKSIDYELNSSLNQSAYSALVNNSSVCAGYARAFQHIMIKLGIPTYLVTGEAEGNHAWNIVKIEDEFYNVDLTWDDNESGDIYAFFNIKDEDIKDSHKRSELSQQLPKCLKSINNELGNLSISMNFILDRKILI